MYLGFIGVFSAVFYLYGIRTDAVRYAFLLSFIWLLAYYLAEFIRYVKHHNQLLETEQKMRFGLDCLPVPTTMMEEDYQRMLLALYEEKVNMESHSRISGQEMADYYSMWAHQIKMPLAAMRILLQTYDEEHPKTPSYFRDMKMELFKVEQYVAMALSYLRIDSISSDMVIQWYSLEGLVKQAVRKYSEMFILQKVGLQIELENEMILTDEKWLVFVLEQVISNALKYTKRGNVSIYTESVKSNQCLVIEDTGIGIQSEDLPRVFEKGFTGYNGRRDKKATGIGLYLCQSVIDKLGHKMWIESEVGIGTKVYLSLERKELNPE